ncbi:transglutaminase-like domain-containing protein [Acidiferrimicrobium sp. IK]|uniref:transglutaminase-like domain-containing protein n=1 Tax=Acidiferrimicrobium sp. IK TaxID=2871700 RepID=UPI0021CB1CD1|nr:transglutaminase-like domain-containing protein [Acidiferrimicrobium sp. IK]MCU4185603.1 transglutaminase-like domain-containing protein [Acidiferrimicrobium sp. IK]
MTVIAGAPAAKATGALAPTRPEATDAAFTIVLVGLGMLGFHAAYGGAGYLGVGLTGAVLGVAISFLAGRLRQPVLAEVAVAVVVFFLLGGAFAVPGGPLGGLVPSGSSLHSLATVGVRGWKQLLTTAPPVGSSGDLLVLPYLMGLVAGVTSYSTARRTRLAALPLLAPAAVLALSILFGAHRPASLLLQGTAFAAVGLAWAAIRHHQLAPAVIGVSRGRSRVAFGAGLLAVAALGAQVVGPLLGGGTSRVVLNRYVVPPFDASALASPLSSFRHFTAGTPGSQAHAVLFRVSGLRTGARVRIATMDTYDGSVWGFAAAPPGVDSDTASDLFRKYGTSIRTAAVGQHAELTVTMGALGGVFVPAVGSLDTLQSTAAPRSAALRYDEATGTVIDVNGATPGATYRIGAVVAPTPTASELDHAAAGADQVVATVPTLLQRTASQWAAGAGGAWAKVMAVASHLKEDGRYSNGTENPPLALPGHDTGRLTEFVSGGPLVGHQIVGDDEQFAATMALMSNSLGVPARVVFGAVTEAGGVVRGRDVHAWVEVSLSGLGWVTVDPSSFIPTRAPSREVPQPQPHNDTTPIVSPPVQSVLLPPPNDALPSAAPSSGRSLLHRKAAHHGIGGLPAWVTPVVSTVAPLLLAVALACGVILFLKARRRGRRRSAPTGSARISGGWREFMDIARDAGHPIAPGVTRREQALKFAGASAAGLAAAADAAVFGPGEPPDSTVVAYWSAVGEARSELLAGLSRRRRLVAVLSPASLLGRPPRQPAAGA